MDTVVTNNKTGTSYLLEKQFTVTELPRICGNCKWFEFVYKGRGVCNNPRIEEYLDQTLDYTREDFGCVPLWEEKESEGEGE